MTRSALGGIPQSQGSTGKGVWTPHSLAGEKDFISPVRWGTDGFLQSSTSPVVMPQGHTWEKAQWTDTPLPEG